MRFKMYWVYETKKISDWWIYLVVSKPILDYIIIIIGYSIAFKKMGGQIINPLVGFKPGIP